MDHIFIRDFRLQTLIGFHRRERVVPQTIRLDLEIGIANAAVFASDRVADCIDYDKVTARIRETCKRVYRNLMLSGYARIDLRLREDGEPCIMEANPNPQLSADEDFADAAKAAGIEYPALVQRIVELGLRFEPSRFG